MIRPALVMFAILTAVSGLVSILMHIVLYPNEYTDYEGDLT